ncbi:putative cytokinetic ring protein SteA [Halonatronum saccharophilum]|uniref:putative cytokinetic ring protein SteA n=1 Tax=Halonatronum saccharophilum TaxID=150060 RepID=UPI00047F3CC6|nr:putative cytokinetic ring protein SteA [Halonatronum saccharophilum]
MKLSGKVRLGKKTKWLSKEIKEGEIALIDHRDIDQLAAQALIEAKVSGILNANRSISGKYPNLGPEKIVKAGILLMDNIGEEIFEELENGDRIKIVGSKVLRNDELIAEGEILTKRKVEKRLKATRDNLNVELNKFVDNTLNYAKKEKNLILGVSMPDIETRLKEKDVLIVVRGKDYREDLEAVISYIREVNPILIAVDGGADALLEYGFKPDIIIGDMDSVSDRALACGAELIVHAYPDGDAPGMNRIDELGLKAKKFPAPGTSEDITMLLAYEKGAELIVAVGTHTTMIDFLEKGRPGMASTFLVRVKVGSKLVDAKGVNKLYKSRIKPKYVAQVLLASLIPIVVIVAVSTPLQQIMKLLIMQMRLNLGL